MPTLILEGPDGLGKTALASLLKEEAERFGVEAEIVVPAPSKYYGKYENAVEWAYHFMRTHTDLPDKLTILDRFPIPSEFVYNTDYDMNPQEPEYQEALLRLSFYPYGFVFVDFDAATIGKSTYEVVPHDTIETDPMFKGDVSKWLRVMGRYKAWRCHNKNPIYDLHWKGRDTRWTDETARNILLWAGVPLKGIVT